MAIVSKAPSDCDAESASRILSQRTLSASTLPTWGSRLAARSTAFDQLRLLDARDHFEAPTTTRALLDLDPEYPL
jgi:hypothetical protein